MAAQRFHLFFSAFFQLQFFWGFFFTPLSFLLYSPNEESVIFGLDQMIDKKMSIRWT